jgi:hypothetical protein
VVNSPLPTPHELHEFLRQVDETLSREYVRIRARSAEDPGTAGDEGEENWAELLRRWLPPSCPVVTKGRIVGASGNASPQVDVLVLRPGYPRAMLSKKLYLSGGVAAAFECKLTLQPKHLPKIAETAAAIRQLLPERSGSVYRELNSTLLFGVLAHSSRASDQDAKGIRTLLRRMEILDEATAKHPRELLDCICISDLATLWLVRHPSFVPHQRDKTARFAGHVRPVTARVVFAKHQTRPSEGGDPLLRQAFTPIGALVTVLLRRLAWELPDLRPVADHFRLSGLLVPGGGSHGQLWPTDSFTRATLRGLLAKRRPQTDSDEAWDEWSWTFV